MAASARDVRLYRLYREPAASVVLAVSEPAFNQALADLQAELPVIGKDQTANAGQFSYSYADLTTIAAKALPLLSKHGLSFTAFPTMSEHGFVLRFSLRHKDGHSEEGFYPLPDPVKANAQQVGSAITYGRRYSLCAVTGIAPGGEDDDAQAASHARSSARVDPLKAARDRVWAAAQQLGWDSETLATDYASQHGGELITNATVKQLSEYAIRVEASSPDVVAS